MHLIHSLAKSYLKNKKYLSLFPKPPLSVIVFPLKRALSFSQMAEVMYYGKLNILGIFPDFSLQQLRPLTPEVFFNSSPDTLLINTSQTHSWKILPLWSPNTISFLFITVLNICKLRKTDHKEYSFINQVCNSSQALSQSSKDLRC